MSVIVLVLYGIGKLLDSILEKKEEVPLWA